MSSDVVVQLLDEQPVVMMEGASGAVSADDARANAQLAEAARLITEAERDAAINARNAAEDARGGAEDARDDAEGSAATAGTLLDALLVAIGGSTFAGTLTVQADTVAALKALSGMAEGKQVILGERGRTGLFIWRSADKSAQVVADPYEGIWIAPAPSSSLANVAIVNHNNTTITSLGGGAYRIAKSAGGSAWNASAVSPTFTTGDFVLRSTRPTNAGVSAGGMVGVNSDPLTDDSYASIDFGYFFNTSANSWYWGLNGAATNNAGDTGDPGSGGSLYVWIWRTAGVLGMGRGATLAAAQAAPDHTEANSSTLYFDSSLFTSGSQIDVAFTAQPPAGTTGAWERMIDDDTILISWYDPPQDGTDAGPWFWSASTALSSRGGGILKLELDGNYRIGSQVDNGIPLPFSGGVWRFSPVTPVPFYFKDCSSHVTLDLNGATVRCLDGKKFGTFNVDGSPMATGGGYYGAGLSTPYFQMVLFDGCTGGWKVCNGELDGNLMNLTVGGRWGDAGYQLPATGISEWRCKGAGVIDNVYSHHHALDGGTSDGVADDIFDPDETVEIINSHFDCNGRQGWSHVRGRGIRTRRSTFNWTGKAAAGSDTLGAVVNTPGAGIDIENETGIIRDFYAEDCEFIGCFGPSLLVQPFGNMVGVHLKRCKLTGTTGWAAWLEGAGVDLDDCEVVGSIVNAHPDTDRAKAARFYRTKFYFGTARSPTGAVYGAPGLPIMFEFGGSGGLNMLFDECIADTEGNTAPQLGRFYNATVRNCYFKQDGTVLAYIGAQFEGRNVIVSNGPVDWYGSTNRGELLFNGVPETAVPTVVVNPTISTAPYTAPKYITNTLGLGLGAAAEELISFNFDAASGSQKNINYRDSTGNIAGSIKYKKIAGDNDCISIEDTASPGSGYITHEIVRFSYGKVDIRGGGGLYVDGDKILGARIGRYFAPVTDLGTTMSTLNDMLYYFANFYGFFRATP